MELFRDHLRICDELHQLALEENRFLKQHQRVPDAPLLERHRALLDRLETSLAALRTPAAATTPSDPALREARAALVAQARDRLLQILHLQKENEQLVLRHSLGSPRLSARPASDGPVSDTAPLPPASRLRKLYDQHPG